MTAIPKILISTGFQAYASSAAAKTTAPSKRAGAGDFLNPSGFLAQADDSFSYRNAIPKFGGNLT